MRVRGSRLPIGNPLRDLEEVSGSSVNKWRPSLMDASSVHALVALSGSVVRALWHPARYSSHEVRLRLRPGSSPGGSRTVTVQAAAAEVSAWMRLLPRDAAR